jgi:hypothetical protein
MTSVPRVPAVSDPCLGSPDRVALAIPVLRSSVAALDALLASFEPDPGDSAPCPAGIAQVLTQLGACAAAADSAGLGLLGRVVARGSALAERIRFGQTDWSLMTKLALEELITVIDMVVDVVELVATDSGCRNEERISLRILASVAPQVLTDVDHMDFREIRFHQAASGTHLLRTA